MNSRQSTIITLLLLSFTNVLQAAKTRDPFYVIAHMTNTRKSLDWAVSQGANGIENDFHFNGNGQPEIIEHKNTCDCVCSVHKDDVCHHGLGGRCQGSSASNNPAAQLQHVAKLKGIALYIVDSKVDPKWGSRLIKAGEAIVPFLDKNLFGHGYRGKVIIGSSKINTYDYIKAAVAGANKSPNKNNYYFTFDGEGNDYGKVISTVGRLTNQRVYGTGFTICLGKSFHDAIGHSVNGKNKGEHGMSYIWTLDKESSMRDYINRGVQGILTNRVAVLKKLATSMGLRLAQPNTNIPVARSTPPPQNKCDCDYHKGGCTISHPAPDGKACKCKYKGAWTCGASLVNCNKRDARCSKPDESKEACKLGRGDCGGY